MEMLQGKSVQGGYACLPVALARHDKPVFPREKLRDDEEPLDELARFRSASSEVSDTLRKLMDKAPGPEEVAILESQVFMVEDPEFVSEVERLVLKERFNAPHAVEEAAGKIIDALSRMQSDAFRERAADVRDIASRLISCLTKGQQSFVKLERRSVLVADYLLPSELMALDPSLVGAICLDGGGLASHVAILSRAMDIPCVIGLGDASAKAEQGMMAAVNASAGILFLDPDRSTLDLMRQSAEKTEAEVHEMEEDAVLPALTKDGVLVRLECNIEGLGHVETALRNGAEGVGLFRTEFLLMEGGRTHTEDEQTEIYSRLVKCFRGRGPVTIRTYDVGGDKVIPDMGWSEDNPVLGWRAVRFCMAEKDIFRAQLRAILRSSVHGKVRLLFPMVSGCDELDEVLSYFESVKDELRAEGEPFDEALEVGTMIEVPSAAITSDILARKVDFFSVGTNDLTQYTVAVDRGNDKVAHLYNERHIGVLRLLKWSADNARKEKIGLCVCGEMAGQPGLIPLLLGLGYRELSMNPASLLAARKVIRSLDMASCEELAHVALSMASCREIENLLERFNAESGNTQQG